MVDEWLHPLIEVDESNTTRPANMAAPGGAASTPPSLAAAQIDSVQISESKGETETEGSTFVNLDTLGQWEKEETVISIKIK